MSTSLRPATKIDGGGGARGRGDPCEELVVPAPAKAPTQQLLLTRTLASRASFLKWNTRLDSRARADGTRKTWELVSGKWPKKWCPQVPVRMHLGPKHKMVQRVECFCAVARMCTRSLKRYT